MDSPWSRKPLTNAARRALNKKEKVVAPTEEEIAAFEDVVRRMQQKVWKKGGKEGRYEGALPLEGGRKE